jgi:hypothetical protein
MVMMMLVVSVNPVAAVVVRPPAVVVSAVIRIAPVIAVVATWVITVISRISVIAIPVRGVTESNSYASDSD